MGRYKDLAEDRMGSRVCDTVWKVGDGYIKVGRALGFALQGEMVLPAFCDGGSALPENALTGFPRL